MLMNGASVQISQQMLTHCYFRRDVAVCLSFTNFFCDWPSVDPNLPTVPYDQKDLCVFYRTCTFVESLTTKHGWAYQKAEFVDKLFYDPLTQFTVKPFFPCKQARKANSSKRARPLIGASDSRPYITYNNNALCQPPSTFTLAYNVRWVTILLYTQYISHVQYVVFL